MPYLERFTYSDFLCITFKCNSCLYRYNIVSVTLDDVKLHIRRVIAMINLVHGYALLFSLLRATFIKSVKNTAVTVMVSIK